MENMDEFGFIGYDSDFDGVGDDDFGASAVSSAVTAAQATPSLSEIARKATSGAVSSVQPTMTFDPEVITLKSQPQPSTSWFTQPTWAGGPPRWQIAVAGSIAGVGLGTLLFAVFSGRK